MTKEAGLRTENLEEIKAFFVRDRGRLERLATELVGPDAASSAVDAAESEFIDMLSDIAYRENPDHQHAGDLFGSAMNLALFLVVRDQGIDAHRFGAAMIERINKALAALRSKRSRAEPKQPDPGAAQTFIDAMQESQTSATPGEFVYEYLPDESNRDTGDWAFNIKSCAICHHFRKYDAMDLVPYMCASDDVMSDSQGRGLVRTGTIALGSKHCDFRYQKGGTPKAVADLYPDRIRVRPVDH